MSNPQTGGFYMKKQKRTKQTMVSLALVILLLPLLQGWLNTGVEREPEIRKDRSIWEIIFTPYIL